MDTPQLEERRLVKTRTVQHPHIPNVSYEVPTDRVDEWIEQGWIPGPEPEPDGETDDEPFEDESVGGGQINEDPPFNNGGFLPSGLTYRPVDL